MLGGFSAAGAGVAQVLLLKGDAPGGDASLLLHADLTGLVAAPHGLGKAAPGSHFLFDLFQGGAGVGVVLQVALGLLIQPLVNGVQHPGHGVLNAIQRDEGLLAVVPAHQYALVLLYVLGAQFQPEGHALHLVLGKLPAGGIVRSVHLYPEPGRSQPVRHCLVGLNHAFFMLGYGDNDDLDGGDAGGQHQAAVVPVGHNNAADHAGRHAPGGLEGVMGLVVLAGEGDVKGLGEAVPEVVAGTALKGLLVVHHALHSVGLLGAVELLLVRLTAFHHRHSQHIFEEVGIDVQHLLGLCPGLLLGGVHGVALLPQKLPVAEEGAAGLLPADDGAPLVVQLGQIPVGVDNVLIVLAEQGLAGGVDGVPLLQLFAAAIGHPSALGGKALHVILLLLEQTLRDEGGQIYVLVSQLLELIVQDALDVLPDGIAVGPVDEHALDGGVVDELCLPAHVRVPLGEVHLHIGDLADLLAFLLCHIPSFLWRPSRSSAEFFGRQGGGAFSVSFYCIAKEMESQEKARDSPLFSSHATYGLVRIAPSRPQSKSHSLKCQKQANEFKKYIHTAQKPKCEIGHSAKIFPQDRKMLHHD